MKTIHISILLLTLLIVSIMTADELDECFSITDYNITQLSIHEELEPYLALPFDTILYCFRIEVDLFCDISGDLTVTFYLPNYYTEDGILVTSLLSPESFTMPSYANAISNDTLVQFHIEEEELYIARYLDFCCSLYVNDICGLFPRNVQLQANVSVENRGLVSDSRWLNNPVVECTPIIECFSGMALGIADCDECDIPDETPMLSRGDLVTEYLRVCNFPLSLYGTVADSLLAFITYPPNFEPIMDSICNHDCEYGLSACYNSYLNDTVKTVWFFIDSLPGDSCICFHSYAYVDSGNTDTTAQVVVGVLFSDAFDVPSPNPFLYDYFCGDAPVEIDEYRSCTPSQGCCCFGSRDFMIEITDSQVYSCYEPIMLRYTVHDSASGVRYIGVPSELYIVDGDSLIDLSESDGNYFIVNNDYCCFYDTIMAWVDPEDRINEISETNNTNFSTLEIGYIEANVILRDVIYVSDSLWDSCDNFEYAGCDRIISYLNIADQNGMPIYGLASECWETPDSYIWTNLQFNEEPLQNPRIISRNDMDLGNSIVFVMDFGNSTDSYIGTIQDEVYEFATSSTSCGKEFGFVKYATESRIMNFSFISDAPSIYSAIYNPIWLGDGSLGIDALLEAVSFYGPRGAYPVTVIYITDSYDSEIYTSVGEVLSNANAYGVRICPIIIDDVTAIPQCSRISESTAGVYTLIDNPEYLPNAFSRICNFINSGYLLAFSVDTCGVSPNLDICCSPPPCDIPSSPEELIGCLNAPIPVCGCGCDLEINKIVISKTDTLTGRNVIAIGDTVHYILEITNIAGEFCPCTALITDSLPGLGRLENISKTPESIDCDSVYQDDEIFHVDRVINWELESDQLIPMRKFIISYDYIFDIPMEIFVDEDNNLICNTANVFCSGENDPTLENNDTIICVNSKKDIRVPTVICPGDYIISGDTISITVINHMEDVFSPVTTLSGGIYGQSTNIDNVMIDMEGSPFDTVTYSFIAPELVTDDIDTIEARYCFITYNSFDELQQYCASCDFEVHLPPCYFRLDRNTVDLSQNANDNVGFHISAEHSEKTNVHIFDSGGALIRDFEWNIPAGASIYTWDMQDKNGKQVGSGVYFIVVDSECFGQKTFKLAVIR